MRLSVLFTFKNFLFQRPDLKTLFESSVYLMSWVTDRSRADPKSVLCLKISRRTVQTKINFAFTLVHY